MNNLDRIYNSNKNNPKGFSEGYINYLISLLENLDHEKINKCINYLENARNNDNTIFIIGNGGSASTASHIGNDFGLSVLKNSNKTNDKSYRAFALTDNVSIISAIGNDSSYNDIFIDQLKVHYRKGDMMILISASGNSPNVIRAAKWFKEKGGKTVGWLGFDGGKAKEIVDLPIVVKSPKGEYGPVEDIHLIINHIIVTWLQYNIK